MKFVYALQEEYQGGWVMAFLTTSPRKLADAARTIIEEDYAPGNNLRLKISQAAGEDGFEINHALIAVHPDTKISKAKLKRAVSEKAVSACLDENSVLHVV